MSIYVFMHSACGGHHTGPGHPERPERLAAVERALARAEFSGLSRHEAPRATREHLLRVHSAAHLTRLETAIPDRGLGALDADTPVSPGSMEAALRAAGAAVAGCDAVVAGACRAAFCAVRPPGHHAEPERAMGFCLFNNAGLAAMHALEHHGLGRVSILDFDVHHGNGSAALARDEPRLQVLSTHQWGIYPGTGAAGDRGPHGNLVNAPLPAGADGIAFRAALDAVILPALAAFAPDLLVISAGFDAHRHDPLGGLALEAADFAHATLAAGETLPAGGGRPILSCLEGGYDLGALEDSAAAHLKALGALYPA